MAEAVATGRLVPVRVAVGTGVQVATDAGVGEACGTDVEVATYGGVGQTGRTGVEIG